MIKPAILLTAVCGLAALVYVEKTTEPPVEIGKQHYRIYRGDGEPASLEDLILAVRSARATFLGESHNDPAAHYLEELILEFSYRPGLILSLEMFETDVQYVVDEYLADLITEDHLIKSARAWRNYKNDYSPLVEFAKEKAMPVIAANAPRRYVNLAGRLGRDSLTQLGSEAKRSLPPLPYAEASEAYRRKFVKVMKEFSRQALERARQAGDEEKIRELEKPKDYTNKLAAQSLWDAVMAYSVATALMDDPEASILHINGSFHTSRRLGIIDHLARYFPQLSPLVVTMLSDDSFPEFAAEEMSGEGDFVIVTDPELPRTYEVQMPDSKKKD